MDNKPFYCSQCDIELEPDSLQEDLCSVCKERPENKWLTEEYPARHGDYFDSGSDDLMHFVIDSEEQALWIRVGPVFGNGVRETNGIWISYQESIRNSPLQGPFLMSVETWRELNRIIEDRFEHSRKLSEEEIFEEGEEEGEEL